MHREVYTIDRMVSLGSTHAIQELPRHFQKGAVLKDTCRGATRGIDWHEFQVLPRRQYRDGAADVCALAKSEQVSAAADIKISGR